MDQPRRPGYEDPSASGAATPATRMKGLSVFQLNMTKSDFLGQMKLARVAQTELFIG